MIKYDERIWSGMSEKKQIDALREEFGVKRVTQKQCDCKRCGRNMTAQRVDKIRTENYCRWCIAAMHYIRDHGAFED